MFRPDAVKTYGDPAYTHAGFSQVLTFIGFAADGAKSRKYVCDGMI